MKRLICLLMFSFFLGSAHAESLGREGNGGDPLALEFIASAAEAISFVRQHQESYPELAAVDLESILRKMEVIVVDKPLLVKKGGFTQNSTAMNSRNPDRVILYRNGWKETYAPEIRQALALHELLGLANMEETGVYSIAQTLLADLYRASANGEKKRRENESVYVAKFSFWLRDSPFRKNLTEMEVLGGEVLRVVDESNQGGEEMVAVVDTKGQYGWTRLENLRKATARNTVSIEKFRACEGMLNEAFKMLERK